VLHVVDCDLLRNSVMVDDVLPEKFLYSCRGHICDGLHFNPLGKVFHRYNDEGVVSLCRCEFADDISCDGWVGDFDR
jgi:hypothetical protein